MLLCLLHQCYDLWVLTFDIPQGEMSIAGALGGQGEEEAMTRLGLVSINHADGVNQLRREETRVQEEMKGQRRKETEVRFLTQIHSTRTRKWKWKVLYTLHFKCLFHEERREVEWMYLDETDAEGFLWKCSSKAVQSQRDKNYFLQEVDTAIQKMS